MNQIKMIVGLSNPKKKYHDTRHNVGSWYIYSLVNYYANILKKDNRFLGFTSSVNIMSNNIKILIPDIFMNINGYAVYKMASFYKINLNQILVVHDDLDLYPGLIKNKYGYGHSGHNGLKSVINQFNKKINFHRLRIGIGRPKQNNEISSFVLSSPLDSEIILIKQAIIHAIKSFCFIKKI